MSLPSRERGLKFTGVSARLKWAIVAPFTGAWIEIRRLRWMNSLTWSLPSRERGLKFNRGVRSLGQRGGRSLHGSVD